MRTSEATISPRPVTFEEVYVTDELDRRPSPASDHRLIKQAIQELAAHMVDGPEAVLPRFVALAMEMAGGVSAGNQRRDTRRVSADLHLGLSERITGRLRGSHDTAQR